MHSLVHIPFDRSQIEQSIHARFSEQVSRHRDRMAVCTPRHRWSYEELAGRVDATASVLLRGLGRDKGRVALIYDHGAPMIAGMLAVMRAGKAYVPLDPGYPEQRLRMMLEDSGAEALVIEPKYRHLSQRLGGENLPVFIDGEHHRASESSFPELAPHDVAYILYTSGSTGRPKGVVQNHRNVLHFIRAYTNNLMIGPDDRLSLLSSYSFDAAVMGIYGGILNGACVFPRSVRAGGFDEVGTWIRRSALSIYHSTPTVFREFLEATDASERFSSVRCVVLGGEPVVRRDVERFRQHFERGAVLVNGLGPTESTVTLQNFLDHDTELEQNVVPVGRPVCDTRVVLYDDAGRESDREGEMTFVSEHVALGYWRNPELSARSFGDVPDAPGLRWYRSGDLARRGDDGKLEFLGRKDAQTKVHGVRIEPGEVEAALQQQVDVAEAVVLARILPGSESPRLVGYVRRIPGTLRGERQHAECIREGLRGLLPGVMVPSAIVVLDSFPKTPTGKIDRRGLPDLPDPVDPSGGSEHDPHYVPPASDAEARLATLWQEMLGLGKVSVTRDFSSLGGDSLTALRIVFKMKALGISHDAATGILNGRSIREIVSGCHLASRRAPTSHHSRVNLLVNLVRGVLLFVVIFGHSLPALARRSPEIASMRQVLDAVCNVATPGFAFVFGLALGKIYYLRFRSDPVQTRRMLLNSTAILFASLLIFSVPLAMRQIPPQEILRWILLHNVLLYYTMAFATASLWFRFIALFEVEYVGCALLVLLCFLVHQLLSSALGPYDDEGGDLILGFLISKFNYFSMSSGVLGGCAAGIYLSRDAGQDLRVIARRSVLVGAGCVVLGVVLLRLRSGSLELLGADERDMGLWRWFLYSGGVLALGGSLARALACVERWPVPVLRAAEVVATFGQCTFPIFAVHIIIWPMKAVLDGLDVPDALGLALLLTVFATFCAWCVSNLHRLYYARSYQEA